MVLYLFLHFSIVFHFRVFLHFWGVLGIIGVSVVNILFYGRSSLMFTWYKVALLVIIQTFVFIIVIVFVSVFVFVFVFVYLVHGCVLV